MNATPFHALSERARESAVSNYWRDILTSPPVGFSVTSEGNRVRVSHHEFSFSLANPFPLEGIACVALACSSWLFTEHGERIA